MKRIVLVTTALLASGALCAQTPAEREKAVKYLQQTRDGVVAATKGLSDAQMKFKAGPDRWSVAETLEHISKAEGFLLQNTADQIMKAPAPPAEGRDNAKIDAFVLAALPDRSHKAQAPEPLVPSSGVTPAESLDLFLKSRAKTIAFVESTQGMREHAVDSPLGQKLDAYQWVLFIAGHSERHTKQILEVKADPNFPKK
jgi:DinB family protein